MATLEIRPLPGSFGAEILGFDCAGAIADEDFARVLAGFHQYSLLVFRDQDLTPERQIAFSRRFGTLVEHTQPQFLLKGYPEIYVVSNVVEGGREIGAKNCALAWHSDHSYMTEPALGSLFYAVTIPSVGGETWFAGMYQPWDDLPAERKEELRDLKAVHDYLRLQQTQFPESPLTPKQIADAPPVAHPLARIHPDTRRRSLFLGDNVISHVVTPDGRTLSRDMVVELLHYAVQEQYVYRHAYKPGDMVFWDNRCTLHMAGGYDDGTHPRRMHRTTVKGDRPF